jgi:predicted phage terminase large subunit-like protein
LTPTYRSIPQQFDSVVITIDTAFKTGASNDYSAALVIGTLRTPRDGSPPGHYLLDAWRGKVEFVELKRKVMELNTTWQPHAILIEDAASGQSLIQELQTGTNLRIKAIKPDRDKITRMYAVTPELEATSLVVPGGGMVA